MIGDISFTIPIPIPVDFSIGMVQTQDFGVIQPGQVVTAIIAALLALIANFLLQIISFSIQRKAHRMDQRLAAYSDLLRFMSVHLSDGKWDENATWYLWNAHIRGSNKVKAIIDAKIMKISTTNQKSWEDALNEIKKEMVKEFEADNEKAEKWIELWWRDKNE